MMYLRGVNGVELFLLGRTLMRIGEEAMPTEGLAGYSTSVRSVMIVASDVLEHPGSSVGEIARRTTLPQSQVSGCVARLREAGAIVTETDPRDRRRVLIRQAPTASQRVAFVNSTTVDAALAAALGTDERDELEEALAALEMLARRLRPESTRDSPRRPASGTD
jgi:DNA-binding MarR family transcriptional regulator